MKKNMMMIACMASAFLQGMENPNSVEYQLELTLVRLTQGSLCDSADGNARVIVVSKNEQDELQQKTISYDRNLVGNTELVPNNIVYIKNEKQRVLKSTVISVVEPCFDGDYNKFKEDLALCYKKALIAGVCKEPAYTHEEFQKKSIALPLSFGMECDVEKRVSIIEEAIIRFIASHSGAYARIHLFVATQSEFDLYKALLAERYRIRQSHYYRCI